MRVVLVDPSRTMRLFVTRLLEAGGHEVRPFADGPEALACMRADTEVDALVTSGELATMSGLELCWETRVLAGRDRPIYVILMSSSIDKSRLGEALDSGADDFISKPPVADELYARLRAAERLGAMQRELVRLGFRRCADRPAQSPRLLRACRGGARALRRARRAQRHHAGHRPLQAHQRPLWPRCRRPGDRGGRASRGDRRRDHRPARRRGIRAPARRPRARSRRRSSRNCCVRAWRRCASTPRTAR